MHEGQIDEEDEYGDSDDTGHKIDSDGFSDQGFGDIDMKSP